MNITIKKRTFLHPSVINLPSNAPKEKEPFFMPWKREPVKKTPIKQTEAYNPTQNIWDFLMFLSLLFYVAERVAGRLASARPLRAKF